jgi:glycosyltransferase involved in cell wall biosynthesis
VASNTGGKKISVVVPVLNNAATLPRCLESIAQQGSTELELIVIDGGSIDGTIEIIKQYEKYITYWETGKDKSISDAFNRGISQASGKLVAILNSDDCWLKDTVQHVLESLSRRPDADVFYGQIRYVDEQTGRRYIRVPDLSKMKSRMYIFHPAMFISRQAYERIGGYSEEYRLAMDSEWCHRAMKAKLKFQKIDHVLADMYLGGRSDAGFVAALKEYRKSLLQHRIAGRLTADFNFVKVLLFKTLARPYPVRLIKQIFFR